MKGGTASSCRLTHSVTWGSLRVGLPQTLRRLCSTLPPTSHSVSSDDGQKHLGSLPTQDGKHPPPYRWPSMRPPARPSNTRAGGRMEGRIRNHDISIRRRSQITHHPRWAGGCVSEPTQFSPGCSLPLLQHPGRMCRSQSSLAAVNLEWCSVDARKPLECRLRCMRFRCRLRLASDYAPVR